MTKIPLRACGALIIAALSLPLRNAYGQSAPKISPVELANKIFAPQMLPQIQLQGRFESFSAYEHDSLEPSSSADFTGETNLISRRTHFDFKNYKSPVAQSKEPALHTFYSVTFDGGKWVVIDSGSKIDKLPQGLTALGEITLDHPRLFLKSLDHLCFPLFPSLLNVQLGGSRQAPLKEVLEGNAAGATVDTTVKGACVILTVQKDGMTDELSFDATKAYALTHRRTDFGSKNNPNNSLVNELDVSEWSQTGDLWFPKVAEFTQTLNGKQMVKRNYKLDAVSVSPDAKPIEAVIPPNTYVTDERTGDHYRTGPVAK